MEPPAPVSPRSRELARQEMPGQLRRDVKLLGQLLGRVLAESGGPSLLEDVERLRQLVISARHSDADEQAAADLVAGWPAARAEQVARAFTCYFHLVNLAEEHQRARALCERDRKLGRDVPRGRFLSRTRLCSAIGCEVHRDGCTAPPDRAHDSGGSRKRRIG